MKYNTHKKRKKSPPALWFLLKWYVKILRGFWEVEPIVWKKIICLAEKKGPEKKPVKTIDDVVSMLHGYYDVLSKIDKYDNPETLQLLKSISQLYWQRKSLRVPTAQALIDTKLIGKKWWCETEFLIVIHIFLWCTIMWLIQFTVIYIFYEGLKKLFLWCRLKPICYTYSKIVIITGSLVHWA